MGFYSAVQRAGRFLQPFYILGRFVWVAILVIFALLVIIFWPDGPSSWHPDWLTTALQYRKTVADFMGRWSQFAPWALAATAFLVLVFLNMKTRRKLGRIQKLLPRLHDIACGVLRHHIELMRSLHTADFDPNHPTFRQNVEKIAPHLDLVCRRVATSFGDITGQKCHCSIKHYNKKTGMVSTKARDDLEHNLDRGKADEYKLDYPFAENTAFRRVLEDSTVDSYVNNDLLTSHRNGQYQNGNPDWRSSYNSTIVLPITSETASRKIDSNTVLGFLTVDSKKARFDDEVSKAVLGQYTVPIHDLLLMLGRVPEST